MDYKEITNKIKPELEKIISFLEAEAAKLHTGRASVSLVENIIVDCFGSKLQLRQLGTISCPEPRQIVIQPWDKSYIEPIEKAIFAAGIRATPVVDKDVVRINLPPFTEEFRKIMLKQMAERSEEARQAIRRWRDEAWREVQDKARAGEIREDDKFRAKDELQKMVDEYNKKIDSLNEKKRKELEA